MHLVYDAGALIAAERGNNADFTALHLRAMAEGVVPMVPSAVLAQVWRDGARQARLARVLRGIRVIPFDEQGAKQAGVLCGRSGTSDVVDASVVILAARRQADIVTGDESDITKLVDALGGYPRPELFVI